MRLLIVAGSDVNHAATSNETPLLCVIGTGSMEAVKMLLAAGADSFARTVTSNYPNCNALHVACDHRESRHSHVVQFLIDLGVDVNGRVEYGQPPLMLAVKV